MSVYYRDTVPRTVTNGDGLPAGRRATDSDSGAGRAKVQASTVTHRRAGPAAAGHGQCTGGPGSRFSHESVMVTVVSGPEQLLFAPQVRAESAPRSHRGELSGELGGKTPGGRRRLERDRHGDHQPRPAPEASDS